MLCREDAAVMEALKARGIVRTSGQAPRQEEITAGAGDSVVITMDRAGKKTAAISML